jgi:hypothetical protein
MSTWKEWTTHHGHWAKEVLVIDSTKSADKSNIGVQNAPNALLATLRAVCNHLNLL